MIPQQLWTKSQVRLLAFSLGGLFWIIFHFFIRFILERFPHKITANVPVIAILLIIGFCILHLSLIYLNILRILKIFKSNSIYTQAFRDAIDFIYWKPLRTFHDNIILKTPYFGEICEDLCRQFLKYCSTEYRLALILFIFNYLLRLLVAISFFIDIIIYNQFAYLYIFLPLIAFVLLFEGLLFIFFEFSFRNRMLLEEDVIVYRVVSPDKPILFVNRKTGGILQGDNYEFFSEYWVLFDSFVIIFSYLKELKLRSLPYVLLFTSSLYICGWGYYLSLTLTKIVVYNFVFWIFNIYLFIEEPFSGIVVIA